MSGVHISSQNEDFLLQDKTPSLKGGPQEFPFQCVLSLAPLIRFWNEGIINDQNTLKALCMQRVQEELKKAPELEESIEDLEIVEKHRELIDTLMSAVFPKAFWERDYSAAFFPFHFRSFYATPSFRRFLMAEDGSFKAQVNLEDQAFTYGRVLKAYQLIAKEFYGMEFTFDYPLIFTSKDPDTGLDRHFKIQLDPRFLEIRPLGEPPVLTDEAKKDLRAHINDLSVWMDLIPPERFAFYGFTVANAVDVTDQEVLSSLKRDLIEKESLFSQANFQRLQERLRTLLKRPALMLGLAAIQGEQVYLLHYGCQIQQSCIFSDSEHYTFADFAGSIYEQAAVQGKLLVVDDLTTSATRSPVEEELIAHGIRNMVVSPLYYQQELIGMLELVSPNPGDLDAIHALKLREVLPLFSMTIKRGMEELHNRIQAIIKEKCTAIHPSVEWRFRQAALRYIERQCKEETAEMEPIVFHDVYPLFGVSDIRSSSIQRNAAIQADLIDQLRLAKMVIRAAYKVKFLPFLDELAYRINKYMTEMENGISAGDEITILDFLQREVESLFAHLQGFGPEVQEQIQIYRQALDPERGILNRRRKEFEESVMLINDTISSYLEAEEERAQAMFPHYFEKHKSDGVEHGIYIGASLVPDGKFDELYLKNLRLWQLIVMCGAAQRSAQIQERLQVPLETSHLILVQSTPLSIRFRTDERQFDVDGAYNIRYEIMKKRIDKAVIKGRNERLTQPNKIAIVYSQTREAMEYRQYIEYLQDSGYLTTEVEDLELEDLQGVQGLKALRVTVNIQAPIAGPFSTLEIEQMVQNMTTVEI